MAAIRASCSDQKCRRASTATGEISPVEGADENSEFALRLHVQAEGRDRDKGETSPSTGHSRPRTVAVVGALFMTGVFSAQIAAISSRSCRLFVTCVNAVVGAFAQFFDEA